MSVVIQNMGYTGTDDECLYTVRINMETPLAECKHFRSDGLAYLLRKMADALEEKEK